MKKLTHACSFILFAIMLIMVLAGCAERKTDSGYGFVYTSFRDIPGVTSAEIEAVRELQNRVKSFIYAVNYSTESFDEEDGVVRGFAALFCQWLSELFDIPFIPRIVEWDELVEGLENGTIDFTGELTANAERRLKYFMTDDIAQRQIISIRLVNSVPLNEIAQTRPLRYAFLDGTTTIEDVNRYESNDFLQFFVDDYSQAYEMLVRGEIDAFFDEAPAEAAFDFYGEVAVSTFFPIIYSPVSFSTQNPELKPIIDIVQKALKNGAIGHLTRIYNEGFQDYLNHKLFMLLTDEEREYIKNNPVIPFAAEITNYPVSFFDSRTGKWEGIAHDVIKEVERLTGLSFERQNDENTHWPELLRMLESGKAAMITELIPSDERIGEFIWPGKNFFLDNFVLVSKSEFRNININEILYVKTGAARDTAHSILFKNWFPNHENIVDYDNTYAAFDALERGEIDVVITSEHQLLIMTNYRELVGYKTNFVFDFHFDSTFGFNSNETILASIVTKAMRLIDVNTISGRWLRRTYDYRVRLAQERIPYMIGVGMLSVGLVFAVILFVRKRREGMTLETLVSSRTKELSENQRQLNDMLRQNEFQLLKLNLMVQATRIGLWDMEVKDDPVNPNNTFTLSDEFRKMLGFTDETDFPSKFSSWSDRLHPDDVAKTLDAFIKHLMDTTGGTPFDLEYRLQKKDGEYAYYRASGETIRDDGGNAVRVVGALLDITETKNLLLSLEIEKEAAQSANKAKTTFLANMSHEIRTPMNAILGMSQILEHENLDMRQMGFVRDISNSALALLSIINDILDLSKIEAGKLELHPVDYHFPQFIDNIVSMFTHIAKNKGLEFLFETSGEIPDCLYGDDIRLRQVLTNICGNSVKFTEKGHIKLSVTTTEEKLVLKIEDTGAGIHKEDLPKLFNAFEQVDKTKNRNIVGTGLGLPICKSFIEMMKGSIAVESEYGFGSAFIVTLPIVKGNPDNITNLAVIDSEHALFAPDAKILVTDDNEFNLKVASGLLGLMNIVAETADSGSSAIELVKQNDYDIVFMDHMMPEKDGIETVREIRELGGKYKNMTIIALTANAVKGAREMFFNNGFNDFIAKPINTDELREIIRKHLPAEKIKTMVDPEGQQARLNKEEELFGKAAITFVKENKNTYKNITDALNSGDSKTAHRIAHTLKSSAGYLGKKELQEAAFSLEQSLQREPSGFTPKQLEIIEKELEKALREFEPLLKKAESAKPNAVQVSAEELTALLAELRPLLEKGDLGASSYVEKLQNIAGMEKLAELIDDYDFEGAFNLLNSIT